MYKYLTLCMSTATTEHPHDLYGVQKVEYKIILHTLCCVIRLVCNMLVNVVVISLYACLYLLVITCKPVYAAYRYIIQ